MGHAAPCCSMRPPAACRHPAPSTSRPTFSRLAGSAWAPARALPRTSRSLALPPAASPEHWQFSATLPPTEFASCPSQTLERQLTLQRQASQALAAAAEAVPYGLCLPPQMLDAAAACVGVVAVACQLGGAPGAPGGLDGPSSVAASLLAMAAWTTLQWLLDAAWEKLRAAKPARRSRHAPSSGSSTATVSGYSYRPSSEGQSAAQEGAAPGNWGGLLLKAVGCLLDLRTGTALDPWLRGAAALMGLCEAATLLSEWADKPLVGLLERTTSSGLL